MNCNYDRIECNNNGRYDNNDGIVCYDIGFAIQNVGIVENTFYSIPILSIPIAGRLTATP
jgi:hypothetical protein